MAGSAPLFATDPRPPAGLHELPDGVTADSSQPSGGLPTPGRGPRAGLDKAPEAFDVSRLPGPMRRRYMSLSEEQQKQFRRNWEQWSHLPKEEREHLKRKGGEQLKQAEEDIRTIIKESGLEADPPLRAGLLKRYIEERKAIELELREILNKEREARLPGLRAKLLEELKAGRIAPVDPKTQPEGEAREFKNRGGPGGGFGPGHPQPPHQSDGAPLPGGPPPQ